MLSWLFGFNYLYDLAIVIVICATIVLCVKSDGFREIFKLICKYVGLPLCAIALIGSAVYSCVHLNLYYTAQGGIYGQLSQIFGQNNQVNVEVDEKVFSFKDVMLTQFEGDTYSAKMISEKVIKLESDESYAIYVNNTPCTFAETSPDHFKAMYTYNFYNKEDVCEKTDTLELYFQLNNKGIEIEVQTRGGSSAVRYWNNYFNKNGFEVKIAKTGKQNAGHINIGDGDVSNYVVATFYNGEEVYLTQVYQAGEKIEFPVIKENLFCGWATEDNGEVLSEYELSQSMNFYAVFYPEREVILKVDIEGVKLYENSLPLSSYVIYEYENSNLPACKYIISTKDYRYELVINNTYSVPCGTPDGSTDNSMLACFINLYGGNDDFGAGVGSSGSLTISLSCRSSDYTNLILMASNKEEQTFYNDWFNTNGFSIELVQIRT